MSLFGWGAQNSAAAVTPNASHRSHQSGLARATGSREQQRVSVHNLDRQIPLQLPRQVGRHQGHVLEYHSSGRLDDLEVCRAVVGKAGVVATLLERGQPIDHRGVVGQRLELIDHQRERSLQHRKRVRGLSEFAQLKPSRKVRAGEHKVGHQAGRVAVSGGEEGQIALPQNQQLEICDHIGEAPLQEMRLVARAVV